jgi:hypothetical protein
MRFALAHTLALFQAGLLSLACTPSTPPPQEPAPTSQPQPGSGGSSAAGTAPSSSGGIASVGGASSANEKMCGGIAGLRCPEKQYCAYAPEARCGAADMSGTCAPIPDVCIQLVDEVCGCDDKTYGNSCKAAQAGVSVAMKGACAPAAGDSTPEGGLCGTRGASRDCAPGLYCAYKADCGKTDAGGACTKKPTICTKIYKPVCGCDGKTHGSACTAAAAGISIAHDGPCKK